MGLLSVPLILFRAPVRLTLRAWELGLSTAAEVARIGTELLDPDRGAPPPDFARHRAPSHPEGVDNGRAPDPENPWREAAGAPRVETAPDAPPAVPDELIPDHVDEEPVLVAEVAEEGAEDGAGPELTIEPPWEGYDRMTAADIRDRLAASTPVEAAAVELYEASGKSRRTVLDAAARAVRQ